MRLSIEVTGLDELMKKFDAISGQAAARNVDKITETYTRKMANESSASAPVDSGDLRASIAASPRPATSEQGVWQYGSDLSYARKQEYENMSRKGFIRKSVWNNRDPYREAVRKEISKWD